MPTFDELVPISGFLTDRQILIALQSEYLIDRGTWDQSMLRHASYTLRLGDRVEVVRASQSTSEETKRFTVIRLGVDSDVLELYPADTALLYSREYLRLPTTVLAFTVARGLLFAESLTPENTYVDPGFAGPLYTTVTNVSNRLVRLEYEMPIARLFFYRLSEPVATPYRSGAGAGIQQQLESVRATPIGTREECQKATDTELLTSVRRMPFPGFQLSELFERATRKLVMLFVLALVWPILFFVANTNEWLQKSVGSFVSNVLGGVVAAIIMIYGPRLYRKLVRQ